MIYPMFEVPGPTKGYVHGGSLRFDRQKAKRYREYDAWREKVRLLANCSQVPDELDPDDAWEVVISIRWNKRAKIDGDGVLKGILDALWGKDRRVLFGRYASIEHTGEECVQVKVQKVEPLILRKGD